MEESQFMKPYKESHIPDHWAIKLGMHRLFEWLTGVPSIPPFTKGQRVRALVNVYHFIRGVSYTVENCFCNKGPCGWNWWVSAIEVPVTSMASDFEPEEHSCAESVP